MSLHRDLVGRYVTVGDYVANGSPRQGYGLTVIRVTKLTTQQIIGIEVTSGKPRRFFPDNCIVITQQLEVNLAQVTKEPSKEEALEEAKRYFEVKGIDFDEEMEKRSGS